MTVVVAPPAAPAPLDLAGALATLAARPFDPLDDAQLVAAAPVLAGLAADRAFLGTLLIREIANRAGGQEGANPYGPQVVMLGGGPGWYLRANLWPAADDPLVRRNGRRRFFYGVAHDHDFSFLTVGYHGPGYRSEEWEYDGSAPLGVPGAAAGLRATGWRGLGPGELLLYRAHRDVHRQHPPTSLSVSLNLVAAPPGRAFRDQFRFDPERGVVTQQLAHSGTEALLALLPELGGEDGRDLLDQFARQHPHDRVRFGAVAIQAGAAPDPAARLAILERAAADPSATVAGLARHQLAALAGR